MPTSLLIVLALALAVLAIEAPPRWAAVQLLAVMFLVPDSLRVPHGQVILTVGAVVVWSTFLGLMVRVSRGEIPGDCLRPTRTHLVLLGFVILVFIVGLDNATGSIRYSGGFNLWVPVVNQFLLLVSLVAFTRLFGVRWMATRVVLIIVVSAGIGVAERLTHSGYASWWFHHVPANLKRSQGGPLERRGGAVRSRASSEFALEYGWIMALFVPMAVAVALRFRWYAMAIPVLLIVALELSVSRSVFTGLGVGMVVMLLLSKFDRRVLRVCLVGAAVGAAIYFGSPTLRVPFHGASPDSIASRTTRALFVGQAVTHPYWGFGLSGLGEHGLASTDDSWVQLFAQVGIMGMLLEGAAVLTPLIVGGFAAWGLKDERRLYAAAAGGGLAAILVGAGGFDAFSLPETNAVIWLFAAIAVVSFEDLRRGAPALNRPSPWRILLPVSGAAIGLILGSFASTRASSVSRLEVLTPLQMDVPGSYSYIGGILVNSACAGGKAAIAGMPVKVVCNRSGLSPGDGFVRIGASSIAMVDLAVQRFDAGARAAEPSYTRYEESRSIGTPMVFRTATVTGTFVGAFLALVLPVRRRRRQPDDDAPSSEDPVAVLV